MSPSSQERAFRKEYASELLRIAEMDMKTAEYLLEGMEEAKEALALGLSAIEWAKGVLGRCTP